MADASPIIAADGPPHRVLLVDDQAMIGEAVRRLVAGDPDITLHYCRDGRAALDAAAEFHPTVILQDLVMPGVDGLDLVRQYRAAPATANVPVIMLSAEEQPVVKAQLLGAGANDYLVKLPDRVELVARIRVHSEAHRRLLERNAAFAALERSLAELKLEREKSERLLLSILPQKIAERLKNSEETIAESFPQVTVLFADLAGFTEFSQNVDARNLVELLDEIFSAFDQLATGLGVEKIKTIGDAYMAVAGLPVPRADHADAVAELALGMQEAFRAVRTSRGLPLELRVGIHSGPVAAGVIGRQKFAYDLWGNTVNLASRMESSGEATRIHVSAATRALLGERFRFEDRGEVAIKGKGPMQTFFLLGRA
ncbi:MAG: response regulator [Planctomycetia bacterium]|nr:response regulator [Planctomycetia bacterium]